MPAHDYLCTECGIIELIKRMSEEHPTKCPKCRNKISYVVSAPAVKSAPDMFWETENRGRGRYIGQLQQGLEKDPNAYCRSQNEAIDKGKRLGFKVTRAR